MEALATKGGHAAASAAEAAAAGDIVMTMLPAGPQVRSVYLDKGGATGGGRDRDGHSARRGRRQSLQIFVDGGAGVLDFSGIYRLIGKSDHNM
jgi:NAD binding domain of 6-phosphogluconate dehydrogenase